MSVFLRLSTPLLTRRVVCSLIADLDPHRTAITQQSALAVATTLDSAGLMREVAVWADRCGHGELAAVAMHSSRVASFGFPAGTAAAMEHHAIPAPLSLLQPRGAEAEHVITDTRKAAGT